VGSVEYIQRWCSYTSISGLGVRRDRGGRKRVVMAVRSFYARRNCALMDMQRSSQLYERLGGGFGNRKLPSAATRARDTAHAK
jgi:hypothetical protein